MADERSGAEKFRSQQKTLRVRPIRPPPTIPEAIRKKFPELEPHWLAYDAEWERYFKEREIGQY